MGPYLHQNGREVIAHLGARGSVRSPSEITNQSNSGRLLITKEPASEGSCAILYNCPLYETTSRNPNNIP